MKSSGLILRKASPKDADGIAKLFMRVWQISLKNLVPENFLARFEHATQKEKYALRAVDPDWILLVAEIEGEVVGMIGVKDNDSEPLVYEKQIKAMYVDPKFQEKGIGTALFNRIVSELKERKTRTLMLWCIEANAKALGFYEKLHGTRINDVLPPEEYSVVPHVIYAWNFDQFD